MKLCVLFVLCTVFSFVSCQDGVAGHYGSPTRSQKTSPSRTTVSRSNAKVSTCNPTISLTTANPKTPVSSTIGTSQQKVPPSHSTIVPKSSGRVPTGHPTVSTASSATPVGPTVKTTIQQKPKAPISRGSYTTSTKTLKSSQSTPPATYSTTTRQSSGLTVSATRTLTVSNGQTASAQVGWVVVGVGVGGSIAVGGNIFHVAGGTEVIIEEGSSGQEELSTVDTSTTSTTSSTSSSSSSSVASQTPYNIYPKHDSTSPQQSAFVQHLEQVAQPGSVRTITGGRDQLLLWVASLTPAQASGLSRNPVVRSFNVDRSLRVNLEKESANDLPPSPDCPTESCSHRKRDGSILMQQNARVDLKVISQASGVPLSGLPGYAYDSRGGRGISVYVMDTGIDPSHPEFRNMLGSIRWLYLPGEPHIEGDLLGGHGTCVTSKVASSTFGVAKSANIVVVKVSPISGTIQASHYTAAWGVVARDITSRGMQGKAVVITTLSLNPSDLTEDDKATYIAGMREVIELDAVLVAASANRSPILPGLALATYPALLATQFPIVVVGGVDTSGTSGQYTQGLVSQLTVSAVGRVACASIQRYSSVWEGTSFAAPVVAGLAAYLMSLDQYRERLLVPGSVARNVRDLIRSLAYSRLPDQPVVIWNGIDSQEIYCPVRRDVGSLGCPARNTTLPIVPPVTPIPIPLPPSTTTGTSTTSVTSSFNLLPSSTMTDSFTTSNGGQTLILNMTISDHDGIKSTLAETITIN